MMIAPLGEFYDDLHLSQQAG